ncbi:MAG: amidohydrolase family protein [Blastocatellia bacterium]|nr:amidohydrolase family protein [Blastocatellia bacterium]
MISILSARWVLPITSPAIEHGAVAIDSNRIAAVGSFTEVRGEYPEAKVTELGEAALLPGLVNVHSHLELTVFRGRLEEPHFQRWISGLVRLKSERLVADDLLASARLGCIEAIRAGVTTLADTSDASAPLAALSESGQRGVIFQECFGPMPEQAESSLAGLQVKLEDYTDKLARAVGDAGSRLKVGISPHAPYSVSERLYRLATRFALEHELEMAIHTAESAAETSLLRDGGGAFGESLRRRGIMFGGNDRSTIEYFARLGVLEAAPLLIHCVQVSDEDLVTMAQHGARVAHCPKSNAKFGHGIAPLLELRRAGVRLGLGTDSVASNNTCDLLEEARFCSLMQRAARKDAMVCSAEEMLSLLTIEGAQALNMADKIGSLERGKEADLIAIDLAQSHNSPCYDPETAILFSCSGRDVILTMVAGRVIYEGGRVSTLDEAEVLKRIEELRNKLV